MKKIVSGSILAVSLAGGMAAAQQAPPVSAELRSLLAALEAGERLRRPVGSEAAPASASEREPNNNRYGYADRVAVDGALTGTIGKKGDVDWWRFRAPGTGSLTLQSSASPSNVNLAVRLWDANGSAVSNWVYAPANGGVFDTFFDLGRGGDYALELRDGSNDAASEDPYAIDLAFAAVPDALEPSSFGTPLEVPVNGRFQATILPKGDVDWIAVTAPDQGMLTMRVNDPPEALNLAVRLWDANGSAISNWTYAPANGAALDTYFDLPERGRYLLELRDGSNDARSPQPFTVELALQQSSERGEPNGAMRLATPLAFDDALRATILPKGDVDWYVVDAPHQGELTVALRDSPENLNLAFRIWEVGGTALSNWFYPLAKGGENVNTFDLRRPGRHFIEVRDGSNDDRSAEPYRITARFAPTADRGEPNDRPALATRLAAAEPHHANILPKGDVDWYRIDLPEQGAVTVSAASPPGLNMAFRVWNSDMSAITNWYYPMAEGGENRQVIDLGRAGSYFLEVRDGSNDARSAEPYRIGYTLDATGDAHEPNDRFGGASRIEFGQPVTGAILPKGDVDWYRLDAGREGVLRIAVTQSAPETNIAIRVWNADASAISNWSYAQAKGGALEMTVPLKEAGSYVLEVRDGSNDASSPRPYAFTANME